ncbi:response regulator [uncultured Desulfobacter sp.]|uniref:response regulator n=1 Tax=uncultured Desulfobacter sp. TaxID=240139 RepID=UPI0029F5345F|nr:response regulator [uncultured Desulfobacter sp.]
MCRSCLVVDDSKPMRTAIKRTILRAGFNDLKILEAKNGKEALSLLKSTPIDLIITDYNMPEMDGLEFITILKGKTGYKDIPVLLMTGEINEARLNKFKNIDVAVQIPKDIRPEELKPILSSTLNESV